MYLKYIHVHLTQAPCPEIYILNAALTDGTYDPSLHLPGPYYSPQVTSHLSNIYPTHSSTPVSAAASHSHSHLSQKHGTAQPVDHQPSATGVQNSLVKSSVMSKKFGSSRTGDDDIDLTNSKLVSQITGSAQHHESTALGYQPQNDSEVHRGQFHGSSLSDDPPAGSDGGGDTVQPRRSEKSGNLVTGTSQSGKKRRVQRVHFESLTNPSGDTSHTFSSPSQDAGELIIHMHVAKNWPPLPTFPPPSFDLLSIA